ncbi:hypothetical protein SARC_01929 [Sphaeroforma arctica JP610]|uniref:Transcription activator GCR1-like domain-containing protein n=1 Tax=Sphaeroforma arctica JP610 TaxID=667725 RepID=A0A0L0GAH7_9EUKA|nr:hypothetical protein SARC_01929 [Sphaeroforma arctica JP610]KNC85891.1 hypothetical protein SARC_01929 [Sphaeroforma arctica JP610]|eukprot:XP_014159793.1 hypothetical protein SARC_01929 [Sphaeroforma arctica JP610]
MPPTKEILLYTNIMREFLKWYNKEHNWDQYEDFHKIDKSLFKDITPEKLVTYMKILAYGIPNPGPEDIPTGQGETGLLFVKRAISYFLPDANKDWDADTRTGNPARAKPVDQLIRVAGMNEPSAESIQLIKRQLSTFSMEIMALQRTIFDSNQKHRHDSKHLELLVDKTRVELMQEMLNLSKQRHGMSGMNTNGIGMSSNGKGNEANTGGSDSYAYGEYEYGQEVTPVEEEYTTNSSTAIDGNNRNKNKNATSTTQDVMALSNHASTNTSHAYGNDYSYNGGSTVYSNKAPQQYGASSMQVSTFPGSSNEFIGNAQLSSKPKTLASLWEEYEIGIGTNKAAREFTQKERGSVRKTYSFRNSFWKAMETVMGRGNSVEEAMQKIQIAYGENASVTAVCRAISRDKDLSRVLSPP